MVVYEQIGNNLTKAYSDAGFMIRGGSPEGLYAEAYDPTDAHRTYVETDKYIDTQTQHGGRVFSKLSLELALFDLGLLSQVDAFIDQQTITNKQGQTMPLRRLYDTALTFSEDNQYFDQFKGQLKDLLGLSDQQMEQILSNCVAR